MKIFLCSIFVAVITISILLYMLYFMRKKFTSFTNAISVTLNNMMTGNFELDQLDNTDTLLAKIDHQLCRLYEIMQENNNRSKSEKIALQEFISDISHQVKTPITNLKIVNSTLLEQDMPIETQKAFLESMGDQLDKLDFLTQSMIKASRLETGLIILEKKKQTIYDTLAMALGIVLIPVENKYMKVEVVCPEDIEIPHDRKWTSEALFNVLDNAVKYTPEEGSIYVDVEQFEMYTRINIKDTGKGIAESHYAEIFKRFYREEEVHDIEGIGIGLYLSREIIRRQGGYIKVSSKVGNGSVFSVYLPNK